MRFLIILWEFIVNFHDGYFLLSENEFNIKEISFSYNLIIIRFCLLNLIQNRRTSTKMSCPDQNKFVFKQKTKKING